MPRIPGLSGDGGDKEVEVDITEAVGTVAKFWWMWLVLGIGWTIAGVVVLQFDQASITTVGVIVGIMFFVTAIQNLAIASIADQMRWLYIVFGVLFAIAGGVALSSPEDTFAALADSLGFIFVLVGLFWVLQAFAAKGISELWWLGLFTGILMIILGFWTGGQFFIHKTYVLLVFAGIWALMHGVTDIVRAFQIRELKRLV